LKITDLSLYPVTTTRLYGEPSQHVLLRLQAQDGTTGWGEMSDVSHLPAMMPDLEDLAACLRALLIGVDAMELNRIDDAMLTNFPGTRFYGLLRAAVSIATHDLKARLLDIPLYTLLGGKRRELVPVCYPLFRLTSRDDVASRVAAVREQMARGFSAYRLYMGGPGDSDEALLDELFGEFGSRITLTSLDASGLLTVPGFMRRYRRLARFQFESVESPVERDDVESIAEIRRSIDHPVSEHVRSPEYAIRLLKARAVDIFNISITVAGGIIGMRQLFDIASAANIECLGGTTQELSVATAAQAHVGVTAPRLDYASDPVGPYLYEQDVVRDRVRIERGALHVPEGPGLGVEVEQRLIHAIQTPLSSVKDVQNAFARG
jgi:L-alanine-DL-glutamate epimerase-like enolase superfamily enzyme